MAGTLAGLRVAFLVATEGTEQVELTEPWEAIRRAGGEPSSRSPGDLPAFCEAVTEQFHTQIVHTA